MLIVRHAGNVRVVPPAVTRSPVSQPWRAGAMICTVTAGPSCRATVAPAGMPPVGVGTGT
ncbi:hypothetical protein [Deinococcus sedimenti]|uniref:hypothetical protein n=1 Tax=Deinococcus sedimenti TaxID=1867090 RepID=UPI001663BED9|nr:hypothetical protein [Deinococcus sedimenti]